ncbi:glycosyltransferase family 2 protein [Haloferula sp.]|uniref:glycosyltransferase family 2 protein n=1 Tax=Haloferula sp. TaxID=2497595 RepID=UPI00329AB59C
MAPDFTVVTPSYNYGRFIGDCLESVASQEGVTLEHLVMDAGSDDNTAEVVSEFPHASFFQEPDKGMSDGINKGFRRASGKWVMWLNADDRLRPGALTRVKEFAEANPDSDVIFGCWNFVDGGGEFIKRMTLFPFDQRMLAMDACYIASTSCFYRRESTISEGHLLNEGFRLCMDGEYFTRLAANGKVFSYLPAVLADFRLHDASISQQHLGKRDMESTVKHQRLLAEPRSIRRVYGLTPFKNDKCNGAFDFVVFIYFRLKKRLLKALHAGRTVD